MNREIKFRGLDSKNKEQVYGVPLYGNLDTTFTEMQVFKNNKHSIVEIDAETLEQFTGLLDKNGIEIYEGDIIKDVLNSNKNGVVKLGEYKNCFDKSEIKDFGGHVGFYVDFGYELIRKDLKYWSNHSEIIGNIHENPELLC